MVYVYFTARVMYYNIMDSGVFMRTGNIRLEHKPHNVRRTDSADYGITYIRAHVVDILLLFCSHTILLCL